MQRRLCLLASVITLASMALTPRDDAGSRSRRGETAPTPASSPAPATRPVAALLLGTYRGTVVDDDETVPCVTTFSDYHGQRVGTYVVREGREKYEGKLDKFDLLSDERGECRFRWHDKNGEGFVTVRVTPDGGTFEGSWGLEVVQDELVWTGKREATPTTRRSRGSNG